jgi:hypothetical protein
MEHTFIDKEAAVLEADGQQNRIADNENVAKNTPFAG